MCNHCLKRPLPDYGRGCPRRFASEKVAPLIFHSVANYYSYLNGIEIKPRTL